MDVKMTYGDIKKYANIYDIDQLAKYMYALPKDVDMNIIRNVEKIAAVKVNINQGWDVKDADNATIEEMYKKMIGTKPVLKQQNSLNRSKRLRELAANYKTVA